MFVPVTRVKRQVARIYRVTNTNIIPTGVASLVRSSRGSGYGGGFSPVGGGGGGGFNPRGPRFPPPPPVSRLYFRVVDIVGCNFLQRKLNDLYLSLQLLNTQATSNDFTVDLTGEFSPNAQGGTVPTADEATVAASTVVFVPGTPFGAFPTTFPSYYDNRMAEFILSDYTINSLFYWLHR
ncbi:hypothetical protein ANCDUO_06816 [Ancylostoma duodenale]|uniref:Uncharacterized protein n=1 Tax=Ancylostoma duodenale TaxID=51022 RepID=A0A0C2H0Q0_9BILA|nr:hypothetical protein ANCDUO_06816 [Ancylostoma duodenale]